jgi:hypothetical protein
MHAAHAPEGATPASAFDLLRSKFDGYRTPGTVAGNTPPAMTRGLRLVQWSVTQTPSKKRKNGDNDPPRLEPTEQYQMVQEGVLTLRRTILDNWFQRGLVLDAAVFCEKGKEDRAHYQWNVTQVTSQPPIPVSDEDVRNVRASNAMTASRSCATCAKAGHPQRHAARARTRSSRS